MILFKKIRYKNFLSSGNNFTQVNLNTHQSNIIVGTNGAGKSTILDALTFVLFNKPFRKVNKPQLVNSINGKDCRVEVEFSIGKKEYKIIRGMKPNLFEVYVDDVMLNQDAANSDQQKFLEQNILKLNYKSFTQIVVLGSSTFVPFMQLPLASRREIIEDLLDIQVFSTMNNNLKDRMKQLNDDIRFTEKDLDLVNHRIETQESLIRELETQSDNRIKEKETKISTLLEEENSILNQNGVLNQYVLDKTADLVNENNFIKKYDNLRNFKIKFKNKINNLTKENKFYESNNSCPTCKQDLDESFKLKKIETNSKSLKETEDAWGKLEEEIEKVTIEISKCNEINKDIQEKNSEVSKNNSLIRRIQKQISELESEILKIQKNKDSESDEKNQLLTLQQTKQDYEKVLSEHKENKDYYSVAANLLTF